MIENLDSVTFAQKVCAFGSGSSCVYHGDVPAIVDFWAEWCPPCKMINPFLEEIAQKHNGRLQVYKVNTDEQPEIMAAFRVFSIPSLLFLRKGEAPYVNVGALPRAGIEKLVRDVLKVA